MPWREERLANHITSGFILLYHLPQRRDRAAGPECCPAVARQGNSCSNSLRETSVSSMRPSEVQCTGSRVPILTWLIREPAS